MPVYEYRCMMCNELLELKRPIEERDDQVKCSACGNPAQRVYHSVNAVFKGGGFYSTDNPKAPKPRSRS
jgi:putative FmdB family regulatory protein